MLDHAGSFSLATILLLDSNPATCPIRELYCVLVITFISPCLFKNSLFFMPDIFLSIFSFFFACFFFSLSLSSRVYFFCVLDLHNSIRWTNCGKTMTVLRRPMTRLEENGSKRDRRPSARSKRRGWATMPWIKRLKPCQSASRSWSWRWSPDLWFQCFVFLGLIFSRSFIWIWVMFKMIILFYTLYAFM